MNLKYTLYFVLTAFGITIGGSAIVQNATAQDIRSDSTLQEEFQVVAPEFFSGRIVFAANVGASDQLFILDLNAKKVRSLAVGRGNNFAPRFSPDGTKIVFVSDRDGSNELYMTDWNGEHTSRLALPSLYNKETPSWSNDGTRIFFAAAPSKKSTDAFLYSIAASGSTLQQLSHTQGHANSPRLSPDNNVLLYATDRNWPGWDICALNIGDQSDRCLLTGSKSFLHPSWSPSGSLIAYAFGGLEPEDLSILNLRTSARTLIAATGDQERFPEWAADERGLIFISHDPIKGVSKIVYSDLDQKHIPILSYKGVLSSLSWSTRKTLELEAQRLRSEMNQGPTASPTPILTRSTP